MGNLRHQKYKNKQLKNSTVELENNFKIINISINDIDKFAKKKNKKESIYKKHLVWLIRLVN